MFVIRLSKFIDPSTRRVSNSILVGKSSHMLSLAELYQKKKSSMDKVEMFRLQQQTMLEQGQHWFLLPVLLIGLGIGLMFFGKIALGVISFSVSLLAFLLVGALKILPAYTQFNDQYKRQVIYALLEDLYPSIYYAPDNYVPSSLFAKAQLYPLDSQYTGKDYVEGETVQGGTFKFSDLSVKTPPTGHMDPITLFKGLFLVIDVYQPCDGSLYILPATTPPPLEEGLLQQPLERFMTPAQNASYTQFYSEFARGFMVYSKDTDAAQSLLKAPLIEALYQWYSKWQCAAHISWIGQQLFIALPQKAAFPMPDFAQTTNTNQALQRFYDQLLYGLSLVEYFGCEDPQEEANTLSSVNLGKIVTPPPSLSKEEEQAPLDATSKKKKLRYRKN